MNLSTLITGTSAGKLNWYQDTVAAGEGTATRYLCSIDEYEIKVSLADESVTLSKGGTILDTETGGSDLVTAIAAYLTSKKEADALGFDDALVSAIS